MSERLIGVRNLLLLLALLTLAACASPADSGASGATSTATSDPAAGGDSAQADNDLSVEFDPGDGTEPERWTLTCVGSVEGSHPDAVAACEHLTGMDEPFAPLPSDLLCTEQFGGPQTAHVTGRWGGEPVDLELSRVDGCHISQWDALDPLLPEPVGVAPPS
jgi:Subtilisin inhibitor-like